jgi:hypothetical protein
VAAASAGGQFPTRPYSVFPALAATGRSVTSTVTTGVVRLRHDAPVRVDDQERGTKVALGRGNRSSAAQVVAALQSAQSRYGTDKRTPYNFVFPNKVRDRASTPTTSGTSC